MPIKFDCGACGKRYTAKDEFAGRQTKCLRCGTAIEIPALVVQDDKEVRIPAVNGAQDLSVASILEVQPGERDNMGSRSEVDGAVGRRRARAMLPILATACVTSVFTVAFSHLFGSIFAITSRDGGGDRDYREVLLYFQLAYVHHYTHPPRDLDEMRRDYTEIARSMPEGAVGKKLLADVTGYFSTPGYFDGIPAIKVWEQCQGSSAYLNKKGVQADPHEILQGALTVMRALEAVPESQRVLSGRGGFESFTHAYELLRLAGRDHKNVIETLIRRKMKDYMEDLNQEESSRMLEQKLEPP